MITAILFCFSPPARALEWQPKKKTIIPDKTSETIHIDGNLDEQVWQQPALTQRFKTFMPVYGRDLGHNTEVRMAYTRDRLYFAFTCHDDEPKKIKTSISQRDKIFNDDWVGVLIDAMGNKQTSYEFYVNPNGIQGDSLNSAVTGTDMAPDFVWESAGRITPQGYQVEMAIPLESIRFKSGKEVKMGILLLRSISRLGLGAAWPEVQPGQTDFNFMATIVYNGLNYGLKLEVLPGITANLDRQRREDGREWGEQEKNMNIGASIKYGISSSITAEATVNPDFSQVESDAFQMEVNRRYPVFYSEKRPFFMEGMDIFDFGIINRGMMIASVHTRNIRDPGWAAKLSGSAGKMNFALLAAEDGGDVWGVMRSKYNLGGDNLLGLLYSGRYGAGAANSAMGMDLQYRPFKNARINASYLYTAGKEPGGRESVPGHGMNAMFTYQVPRFLFWTTYERYDKNFMVESAFINRSGLSRFQVYAGPNIYPRIKKMPWLLRVEPHLQYAGLRDLFTGLDDGHWRLGVDLYFTRQIFLKLEYRKEKEAWAGHEFDQHFFYAFFLGQPFKWLNVYGNLRSGGQVYYDPSDPFMGFGRQFTLGVTVQPGINLNIGAEWLYNTLFRDTHQRREKHYTANITNLQATYQFNRHFFVRGAVRYDSFQKKMLSDLLASFTLIPGTVMHLGYGSIHEKRLWTDNRWLPGQGNFVNVKHGLFLKISYLWQIK
jgi:hypothetical protein